MGVSSGEPLRFVCFLDIFCGHRSNGVKTSCESSCEYTSSGHEVEGENKVCFTGFATERLGVSHKALSLGGVQRGLDLGAPPNGLETGSVFADSPGAQCPRPFGLEKSPVRRSCRPRTGNSSHGRMPHRRRAASMRGTCSAATRGGAACCRDRARRGTSQVTSQADQEHAK